MAAVLPRVPSKLLRLALRDLRELENDPKYHVTMATWHDPDYIIDGSCGVCVAGAIMALTLGADPLSRLIPPDFAGNRDQLLAVDWLRRGSVEGALEELGVYYPGESPADRVVPHYSDDREAFYATLEELAYELEAAGL